MDLRHGRFGNEVKKVGARSAQADNRNALTADANLNRRNGGPCLKRVGYVEGVGNRESSRLGVAGGRHGTHDVLRVAVEQIMGRLVRLRTALSTSLDGDV